MQMFLVIFGPGLFLFFSWDRFKLIKTMDPKFYPCENNTMRDGRIHLSCKHRDLRSIPYFKSPVIISLNLDENRINRVKSSNFLEIPNVRNLSLMWNCLPGRLKALKLPSCEVLIDPDAFLNLKNLTILQLAGNSLKTIPLLPQNLEVLGLEFNNIFHIEQPIGTPFLKQLHLAKNCYYANPCNESLFIHTKVFQELRELQNLTLGFNNMTIIPDQLPPSLESLDLSKNRITGIWEGSFINLTKLSFLNLEWNCQRCDHAIQPCFPCPNNSSLGLHAKAFFGQRDSLVNLNLKGNSIYSIPKNIFAELKGLKTLDLSDNFLAYSIRNGTFFEELQDVVSLKLLYNYQPLKSFSELILSPSISKMKSLRELYLSGLFFHKLTSKSLWPLFKLDKLEYLDLSMNFIISCNVTAFNELRSLRKVVLSKNMISLNPYCTASSTMALTLDRYQKDDHLPLQYIPAFESNLQINQWHCTDKECPKGYSMWYFKKCFCYGKLFFDLSQNNIPWLNTSTFKGMEKTVCLDLSYNYISQMLNGQQFNLLTSLVYLNMAYNRIDLYFYEAFQELRSTLKVLDLSNNEFHFQMRGIGHRLAFLNNLCSLEVLSLANNKIGMRISNTLHSTTLKCLLFSGNRLDIMWDARQDQYIQFFQGLTNLTYLDISENQLRSCSPEAIVNLPPSIRVLRMDSNLLNYFPWENISILNQLCYLNLSENFLFELPNKIINFGRNFKSLDLSHNRLWTIPEYFFTRATGLKELMLNHNQIKILEMQALPSLFQKGKTICTTCKLTLHANPFTCSCTTSWFTDFLRKCPVDIPHLTTDVRCGFPESQNGVNVLSIDLRSCQEIYGSISFLFTFLLTIAASTIPILRHLYGWNLWYCFQIFWAGHKGYTPLYRSKMNNQHDAFVVFDTKNKAVRDWIYNELLINLESKGQWKLRLCLEERDWIPGVSCIENLHNAVYNSRKTVFVLTNHGGTASVNGVIKQAFLLVQQRLLDEKVDVAIIVLLDHVFPKLKYLQLRKWLCRKSVLSWPKNPRAQPLFWNDFHIAVASDNKRSYNKKVTESFLTDELL